MPKERGESSGHSPRVPLRRLKTSRFKTLAQRNNDNARRRAKYAVEKYEKYEKSRPHRSDSPTDELSWDDIKESREAGYSWSQIDQMIRERAELTTQYEAGTIDLDAARNRWDNRDPDLPESLYYYHGLYR